MCIPYRSILLRYGTTASLLVQTFPVFRFSKLRDASRSLNPKHVSYFRLVTFREPQLFQMRKFRNSPCCFLLRKTQYLTYDIGVFALVKGEYLCFWAREGGALLGPRNFETLAAKCRI